MPLDAFGNRWDCSNCVFFDPSYEGSNQGSCRRKAPERSASGFGLWPDVMAADWCGEWKPTPTQT